MSFTPNIPQSGQSLGNSRTQVLNNFASLRATMAANHVDVNLTNPGWHTYIKWSVQASDPTTGANEINEYVKVVGGVAKKFLATPSAGAIFVTYPGIPPSALSNGYSYLPGGLLIQWGSVASPGTSGTVTFATANIAFPTNLFNVQLTMGRVNASGGSGVAVIDTSQTFDKTTFSYISSTSSSVTLYWVAIGN